jgi:hypothetical protein
MANTRTANIRDSSVWFYGCKRTIRYRDRNEGGSAEKRAFSHIRFTHHTDEHDDSLQGRFY